MKLIMAIALSFALTNAHASEVCDRIKSLTSTIITAKYRGATEEAVLEATSTDNQQLQIVLEALIKGIYDLPNYSGAFRQKRQSDDAANETYRLCIHAGI